MATFDGSVLLTKTGTPDNTITLVADSATVTAGGRGTSGNISVRDSKGRTRILLSALEGRLTIFAADGSPVATVGSAGDLVIGGQGGPGRISLRSALDEENISLNGTSGTLRLGGRGADGELELFGESEQRTVSIRGSRANLFMGGNGEDGDIVLFPANVSHSASAGDGTIHLDGSTGDIVLRNADCAEDFDVAGSAPTAGSVLVIQEDGNLAVSDRPYDRRVAGVVSGAAPYRSALVLDRRPNRPMRVPIALTGKVMCYADADHGSINVGDLLTTSSTPGHAMVAHDPIAAFGSVLGKALAPLLNGRDLIPVLVALQ